MLFHHLFYSEWSLPLYDDITIHGNGVINQLGIFSKLCVAVFVFVSGYGLVVSTPIDIKLKDFYWHRFKKLYLNYWFVWILFVPISVFVFGRTFIEAYGNHYLVKAILEFFGLSKMIGIMGYNPTWWFYSCIVLLYLLFPLLYKYMFKCTYLIICLAVTIVLVRFLPGINLISDYLFAFVTGMLIAKMPISWIKGVRVWHIVVALLLLTSWRFSELSPTHIVDGLLCVGMALLLYKIPMNNWTGRIMENLGKHSMNMFLIHTFIFYYWFRDYIYFTRNPILIFLSLLITSYLFSLVIEWLKRISGFYRLINR